MIRDVVSDVVKSIVVEESNTAASPETAVVGTAIVGTNQVQ